MTNKQILKEAIEKAVKGGYFYELRGFNYYEKAEHWKNKYMLNGFIFSHDFAKAFWGEEKITICCNKSRIEGKYTMICEECGRPSYDFDCEISWTGHLQQMVLEKKPLKYLEKFL